VNEVALGSYWTKILRIGPNPKEEGDRWPKVEMYFLPVQCQHCKDPECVKVCPTQASHKREDGTVQIDKSKCIGCQFCVMACPYGVRYLNEEERVVEKCTLCEQKIAQGELPQCVSQCGGRARFFGDLDEGIESFRGPTDKVVGGYVREFDETELHTLPDAGNKPSFRFILRKLKWRG
jgi:Fe-S-cluster-containing dehydrogenase component